MTGNGWLPVLDLEIFVVNNRVEFSFYKKPIASPFTIMFKSALSKQTKRNSLFQEGLRRLRNCSEGIGWDEKASVLTDYMNCLKWSGYDHEYRVSILTGVLERYDQIQEGTRNGTFTSFKSRPKFWKLKQIKLANILKLGS